MSDIVRIFALGGLDENGKNMYVVEINDDIFVFVHKIYSQYCQRQHYCINTTQIPFYVFFDLTHIL